MVCAGVVQLGTAAVDRKPCGHTDGVAGKDGFGILVDTGADSLCVDRHGHSLPHQHRGDGLDTGAAGVCLPIRLLAYDGVQVHTDAVGTVPRLGGVAVVGYCCGWCCGGAVVDVGSCLGRADDHRGAVCRHGGVWRCLPAVFVAHEARRVPPVDSNGSEKMRERVDRQEGRHITEYAESLGL